LSYLGAPFQSDPFDAPPLDAGVPDLLPASAIAPAPFVWGRGGQRMTPDQVERERQMAQGLVAQGMDFSPVQSWTQGLARVADGIVGGLDNRRANKAADANAAESQSVIQALLSADDPKAEQGTVLSALANPYIDAKTRALVGAEYSRLHPAPQEPHFFEANNGDQGAIDPATGQVKIMYHDPTPKVNWVTADNGDGTKQLIPVVNGVPVTGGGMPGAAPPATLPPDFNFGGPTPQASGGFP
jgi:hypothetical protein